MIYIQKMKRLCSGNSRSRQPWRHSLHLNKDFEKPDSGLSISLGASKLLCVPAILLFLAPVFSPRKYDKKELCLGHTIAVVAAVNTLQQPQHI
jgi:hypothetical protein